MDRAVSCGILLVNEWREVLLAHATGRSHWDVLKGLPEPGEAPLAAALREAAEESGLDLEPLAFVDLGVLDYRRDKALHLFAARLARASVDPAACVCTSHFLDERTGRSLPEMDRYAWIPENDLARHCGKNLRRVLAAVLADRAIAQWPLQFLPGRGPAGATASQAR